MHRNTRTWLSLALVASMAAACGGGEAPTVAKPVAEGEGRATIRVFPQAPSVAEVWLHVKNTAATYDTMHLLTGTGPFTITLGLPAGSTDFHACSSSAAGHSFTSGQTCANLPNSVGQSAVITRTLAANAGLSLDLFMSTPNTNWGLSDYGPMIFAVSSTPDIRIYPDGTPDWSTYVPAAHQESELVVTVGIGGDLAAGRTAQFSESCAGVLENSNSINAAGSTDLGGGLYSFTTKYASQTAGACVPSVTVTAGNRQQSIALPTITAWSDVITASMVPAEIIESITLDDGSGGTCSVAVPADRTTATNSSTCSASLVKGAAYTGSVLLAAAPSLPSGYTRTVGYAWASVNCPDYNGTNSGAPGEDTTPGNMPTITNGATATPGITLPNVVTHVACVLTLTVSHNIQDGSSNNQLAANLEDTVTFAVNLFGTTAPNP